MTDMPAQCPNHRYGQVTFTCVRCGTFGCNACRSPVAGPLCSPCGARASASGLPVVETLVESLQFLSRRPALLLAVAGAYTVYGLMTLRLGDKTALLSVMGFFVSTLAEVFLIRYVGDQLDDPERTMVDSLKESTSVLLPGLVSNVLVTLAVAAGFLACIVPGIFVGVALCLAIPAVVLHGAGALESVQVSWTRTEGSRWPLCGLIVLAVLICMVVGAAGGLLFAVLTLLGRMGILMGALIFQAIYGLGLCFLTTVLTFGYLKLAGEWTGERQVG